MTPPGTGIYTKPVSDGEGSDVGKHDSKCNCLFFSFMLLNDEKATDENSGCWVCAAELTLYRHVMSDKKSTKELVGWEQSCIF